MNRTITVALALAAGFVGALLTRYLAPPPAFAQNQAPPTKVAKEIRAQSFTLVDPLDRVAGTFSVEPLDRFPQSLNQLPSQRIVLRDSNGREIWTAGGNAIRPVTER
jgi:hypothetical protein